jgi:hypothetical protein
MTNAIVYGTVVHGPPARTFLDGSQYWVSDLLTVRIGLGHYRPGWVWSEHAGAQTGKPSQAHVGYIQSGTMMVEDSHGNRVELHAGDAFELAPGCNAWVIGGEACVALDVTVRPTE